MKKNVKKLIAMGLITVMAVACAACSNPEETAPESIAFSVEAQMLAKEGDTFDAAAVLEIAGENVNSEVTYSSSDEAVVTVSEDGVVTAEGFGTATITAASVVDETVAATMDVAVYDFSGTYSGEKYIDAMSCDIAISITLNEDGTYSYYRAPMVIQLEGGGEMPELTEEGTFVFSGAEIIFTGDVLGEYTATFNMTDGSASLEGKLPTGGASTDMVLALESAE